MFEPPGDTPLADPGVYRPPPPKGHYSGDEVSRAYTTVGNISRNQSAKDITCVTLSIAPFCHWRLHDDPMGSDTIPLLVAFI
ncbi:unnamed protein product [Danaus chrysippus]|uniref:(African queen) hypothetical protein n=1 Tax=Danaus chrysippus TaxID=151541 RepID=A0A8J2QP27_9NEOP|nr:unnamed protein product [Danaus chrysippus]